MTSLWPAGVVSSTTQLGTARNPIEFSHGIPLTHQAPGPDTVIYKILPSADWQRAVTAGQFDGSTDDVRDGFIHLSSVEQLAGTAAKFFKGQDGLILVSFRSGDLGDKLVWEPSRGGALFPHLYAPLPAGSAIDTWPLDLDSDGIPVMPRGLS